MKATLYMPEQNDPVAIFDEVKIVKMNDNHVQSQNRITYKSRRINASRTMVELHRDIPLSLRLEDGRNCEVMLQHASMDQEGNAVGVLRVLGDF